MLHPLISTTLSSTHWAMHEPFLQGLARASWAEEFKTQAVAPAASQSGGTVAVIPIMGVIEPRKNPFYEMFGLASTSTIELASQVLAAANDASISSILLYVDSPGGATTGLSEAAEAIKEAGSKKQVVAFTEGLNASAAYWLSSQANEIWASPSSMVGSIGVYMLHMDYSQAIEKEGIAPTFIQAGEYKTESTELKPLTDDAKAHYQSLVDADYKKFISAVALGRGISEEKVLKNYGQGRIFNADMAKEQKMVDKVGTFNQLLKKLGASAYKRTKNRRKAQALALQMEMATLG